MRASGRKRKNEIISIVTEESLSVDDDKGISDAVLGFYSKLFTSACPSSVDVEVVT